MGVVNINSDTPAGFKYLHALEERYEKWLGGASDHQKECCLEKLQRMQNDFTRSPECTHTLDYFFRKEGLRKLVFSDAITLYCVNRNNYSFIQPWLSHYRSLGVQRFVIIDDGSKPPLKHQMEGEDVYIVEPIFATFKTSKVFWMKLLMANFQKPGSWVVTVDIDEFLDLPLDFKDGTKNSLEQYCNVLDRESTRYTVGLLCDMMPEKIESGDYTTDFLNVFNWFYYRPINWDYEYCENKEIQWTFGEYWYISFAIDVRYRLFGTIDSLRKIPIFKYYPEIDLNQGFHCLYYDGIPTTWGELFAPGQGVLPIRHYKMVKILYEGKDFDNVLERKNQYFHKTSTNLKFIDSVDKEYIRRVWNATLFKREYTGLESFPHIKVTPYFESKEFTS